MTEARPVFVRFDKKIDDKKMSEGPRVPKEHLFVINLFVIGLLSFQFRDHLSCQPTQPYTTTYPPP